MTEIIDSDLVLTETPRRKAREQYARFLLFRAQVDDKSIESFLNTKQAVLHNESPLLLIYTGRYESAIAAVEAFTEDYSKDK